MNIHPIFVHFPIALLTLYSLLELFRFKKLLRLSYWFYLKAAFLFSGVLMAIPTILTGKLIESQFFEQENLVRLHSRFSYFAIAIYGILAISYVFAWLEKEKIFLPALPKNTWLLIYSFSKRIFSPYVLILVSILGLLLLTVTGTLGGIIVFGQNFDPFTALIYRLFFSQ